jgi:hypothetical protein
MKANLGYQMAGENPESILYLPLVHKDKPLASLPRRVSIKTPIPITT